MKNNKPPDDWGENTPTDVSEESVNASAAKDADELRTAWIMAVRHHQQKQHGQPCYYNSKVMWDGGLCQTTRRIYKPVWPKLVEKARCEGLDPIRLVAVLFAAIGTGPSPKPHDITSPANVARLREASNRSKARAAVDLRTEEVVFRSALWAATQTIPDPAAAVRFVLNDMSRPLSPLFRYSAAVLHKMSDIADRWRPPAENQTASLPDGYLEEWAAIVPNSLLPAAGAAERV